MANPNSSAQRSFASEPYESLADLLESKQITLSLAGKTVFTKSGLAFSVVLPSDADIVHPITGAGLKVAIPANTVSVSQFNAPQGVTNDATAPIQKALNSGAKVVFLDGGTYRTTAELNIPEGVSFIGRGGRLTAANGEFHTAVVVAAPDVSVLGIKIWVPTGTDALDYGISVRAGAENATISNCKIVGLGNRATVAEDEKGGGIHIQGGAVATKVLFNTIRGIKGFGNVRGDGVTLRESSGTRISGNTIVGGARMQIAIIDNATGFIITGNDLDGSYLVGIDIEPNSVNSTGKGIIANNHIRNFAMKPSGFVGGQFYGIDLRSNEFENIIITGNIIEASNPQSLACINAQNNARYASITDNILLCNGVCKAITLSAGNGFEHLIISKNTCREFVGWAVEGYQNSSVSVIDNTFHSSQDVTGAVNLSTGTRITTVQVMENRIKLTGASGRSPIVISGVQVAIVKDNISEQASGPYGVSCYSNTVQGETVIVDNNRMKHTGSDGVSGIRVYAASPGAWPKAFVGVNSITGFPSEFSTSGPVTFVSLKAIGGVELLSGAIIRSGVNNPEGNINAPPGSMLLRDSGSSGTNVYLKVSGMGNTGWVSLSGAVTDVVMPGPYADDAAAATGGVQVNRTYRKTGGTLAWRQA